MKKNIEEEVISQAVEQIGKVESCCQLLSWTFKAMNDNFNPEETTPMKYKIVEGYDFLCEVMAEKLDETYRMLNGE